MVCLLFVVLLMLPATAQAAPLVTFLVAYGPAIAAVGTVATTAVALATRPKFPDVPTPGDVEAAARAGAARQLKARREQQTQTVFGGESFGEQSFLDETVVIAREPLGPQEEAQEEVT